MDDGDSPLICRVVLVLCCFLCVETVDAAHGQSTSRADGNDEGKAAVTSAEVTCARASRPRPWCSRWGRGSSIQVAADRAR